MEPVASLQRTAETEVLFEEHERGGKGEISGGRFRQEVFYCFGVSGLVCASQNGLC